MKREQQMRKRERKKTYKETLPKDLFAQGATFECVST